MREIEKLKPNPKPTKAIEEDWRKDGKGGGAQTQLRTRRSIVCYVVLHIYPSSMYVKMTSPMKKKRNKYIYIIRIN